MRGATIPRAMAVVIGGILASQAFSQADAKVTTLGKALFSSKALSSDKTVSCATCHLPDKSFADGKPEAEGAMKIAIGRNTPTLFGIGTIPKFRDPRQAQDAKPGKTPKVLGLEDRCLAPLENELEMGPSIDEPIAAMRKDPEMTRSFNEAFGDQDGVTKPRVAKALASFVRGLASGVEGYANVPYAAYLAGKTDALSPAQAKGLEVFKTRGCAECHSGPALSDGMMHIVDPPWGQRMLDRQRTASERRIELLRREYAKHKTVEDVTKMSKEAAEKEAKLRANTLPGGGGYDADQIEVQTTTLWDVKRTAPYFRDGSVKSLADAVTTHIREMRVVRENEPRIKKELLALEKSGKRSPTALRATTKTSPIPADGLPDQEFKDLLEFLNALSPGGQ